ncbi:MAG: hypothetical protein WBF47_21720, partial [Xanthobacteraceae bacterium]
MSNARYRALLNNSNTGAPEAIFSSRSFSAATLRWARASTSAAHAPGMKHPSFVGEHDIARIHRDAADHNRLVDGDGFDPPFSGDRADALRPDRVADAARMIDI